MTNRFNFERSKILKTLLKALIFFSGIAILIWQVNGTFDTFIKDRTSIATSQKPFDSLVPPTIIFCSRHHQAGGNGISITNISNEDRFSEQFIWINQNFNLTTVIPRLMRSLRVRILGMRSFENVQIDSVCAF